jgi:hypothetical protein
MWGAQCGGRTLTTTGSVPAAAAKKRLDSCLDFADDDDNHDGDDVESSRVAAVVRNDDESAGVARTARKGLPQRLIDSTLFVSSSREGFTLSCRCRCVRRERRHRRDGRARKASNLLRAGESFASSTNTKGSRRKKQIGRRAEGR